MKRTLEISINRQTLRNMTTDETTKVAGGVSYKCTTNGEGSHCPTCGNGTACRSWNGECE